MKFDDFSPVIPDNAQEIAINAEKALENFQRLYSLNLNDKVENKNGLTYLTWSTAWAEFKKVYPTATYRVIINPATNLPYFSDPETGIMVFTEVTADGITHSMWLPVMDSFNRAIKSQPYTYQVWDKKQNRYVEKKVEAATMFDVNKTIMRCLVKNLAMYGLGLYVFAGEDVPEQLSVSAAPALDIPTPQEQDDFNVGASEKKATTRRKKAAPADPLSAITTIINGTTDMKALVDLYLAHKQEVDSNPTLLEAFTRRKIELQGFAA